MTTRGVARNTRPKKLVNKTALPILREYEVENIDDDVQRNITQLETGVERAEESEFHLQAAINAATQAATGGGVVQSHIPTPDTILSNIQYDNLYLPVFSQPATYIRFSSTVEDCIGSPYSMDEEDEVALKIVNQKKNAATQCSEDQFEEVMNFFEETAQTKQPFAAVDNPPVLNYDEMEEAFDETIEESVRRFAKDIYEHWRSRRIKSKNKRLQPHLKFETGQDTDDGDPYVCFRRREVRQIRKTRGRDAQSADKLRKLRKELEDARQLVAMIKQREVAKNDMLAVERELFERRAKVKETKRKLGIKGDDEDLINQKPKKKPIDVPTLQRGVGGAQFRFPPRPGGGAGEDLQLLEDVQAQKDNEIMREINANTTKHNRWNEGYVDMTKAPLTPTSEKNFSTMDFRPAMTTEYLPTPPASVSSEPSNDAVADVESPSPRENFSVAVRYASPTDDERNQSMRAFRRRQGRGGRMLIDRRNMPVRLKKAVTPMELDRLKYDQDDDDKEPTYEMDPYSIAIMQQNAYLFAKSREQAAAQAQVGRRLQLEAAPSIARPNGVHQNGSSGSTNSQTVS